MKLIGKGKYIENSEHYISEILVGKSLLILIWILKGKISKLTLNKNMLKDA